MNLTPCTEESLSGTDEGRLFAFSKAPRCGAMAKRRASLCLSPAVRGKARCRMHGGARGGGAPKGSQNAIKHGYYTHESIMLRRLLKRLLQEGYEFINEHKGLQIIEI